MNSKRKVVFYCEEHEDDQLNMICIDSKCKNKGIICAQCLCSDHSGHKVMPYNKFIKEYRLIIEDFKEKTQNNENKQKQENPKIKIQDKGKESLEILENFKNMVVELVDQCKDEIDFSIKQKQKQLLECQELEEEALLLQLENNKVQSSQEAIQIFKSLSNKVKNTNDKNNQMIIELKGLKAKSDEENIKQKILNLATINQDMSTKLGRLTQNIMATLDLYKTDTIVSQPNTQKKQTKQQQQQQNFINLVNKNQEDEEENDEEWLDKQLQQNATISNNNQKNDINDMQIEEDNLKGNKHTNYDQNNIFDNENSNKIVNNVQKTNINQNHLLNKYDKKQKQQQQLKIYNSDSDNEEEEIKEQIQQVRAVESLQPYHKKKDINLTQMQQLQLKNQNKKDQNIKNKFLTRQAQHKQQNEEQDDQQNQYKQPKQKPQYIPDTMEDLFSSQGIQNLLGNSINENQQQQIQPIQQQQQSEKNPFKKLMKDSNQNINDLEYEGSDNDIDDKALQNLLYMSQKNQEDFYQKYGKQSNIGPDQLGEIALDIKQKNPLKVSQQIVRDIIFIDLERIATCGFDKQVRVWNIGGKKICTLKQHTDIVQKLAYSQKLKLLASVGKDCSIILYEEQQQTGGFTVKLQQNSVHDTNKNGGIFCVQFLNESEKLITGGGDNKFVIWSIQNNFLRESYILENNKDICFCIMYSTIRKQLISGGQKYISIWRVNSQELGSTQENTLKTSKKFERKKNGTPKIYPLKNIAAHTDYINQIICLVINKTPVIISASDDKTCKIFDAFDYTLIKQFQENLQISSLCYIDMTSVLVISTWGEQQDGGIIFWDISEDQPQKIQEATQQVKIGTPAVRTNEDNSYMVSCHVNGKLEIFKLNYEIVEE